MTAKQATRLLIALTTVLLSVAVAQQQAKPNLTISFFTKGDPKYGDILSALADEPKCATVDVNLHDDSALWLPGGGRATKVDATHETWWLVPGYSRDKRYRYIYALEPPGTLTANDMVMVFSYKTSRGLAEHVCSQVTGSLPGARIHVK